MSRRLFALAVIALAGCGSGGGKSTPTTTSAPAARAVVPSGLVGTYTRTITKGDIRAAGASLAGPPQGLPTGEGTMTIGKDGTVGFVLSDHGTPAIRVVGTEDGVILVEDVPGNGFCVGPSRRGVYAYSVTGAKLTLSKKNDAETCRDRAAALVGRWARK